MLLILKPVVYCEKFAKNFVNNEFTVRIVLKNFFRDGLQPLFSVGLILQDIDLQI